MLFRSLSSKPVMALVSDSILKCKSIQEIDQLVLQTPSEHFGSISCSMALSKLGQYKSPNPHSLQKLLAVAETQRFNPKTLSATLQALANGRLVSRFPDFLLEKLQATNVKDFTPRDFSTVLWSFARIGHRQDQVWQQFTLQIEATDEFLSKFNAIDLSNTMWALATLHRRNSGETEKVCEVILKELESRELDKFQAQNLVNLVWALAKMNHLNCKEFASRVSMEICDRRETKEFTPQGISNLLWAYQKLHQPHLPLANKFVHEILQPSFKVLGL
ncbi:hypothetical protein BASA81_008875 [Batrachochytrium salamandrivorans]|nr:hypothetical protein BASA81_008875 [Batrachochytrium salamandrivorans]